MSFLPQQFILRAHLLVDFSHLLFALTISHLKKMLYKDYKKMKLSAVSHMVYT